MIVKTVDGGKSWNEVPLMDEVGIGEFGVGFTDEKRCAVETTKGGFET